MNSIDFLELLVRDHCYGQWHYKIEQDGDYLNIYSDDAFCGSFLSDLCRVCKMLCVAWGVELVNGKLLIRLYAGKDLFKAGVRDE